MGIDNIIKISNNLERSERKNQICDNYIDSISGCQSSQSFVDHLLGRQNWDLAAHQAITYWKTCNPLSTALEIITSLAAIIL